MTWKFLALLALAYAALCAYLFVAQRSMIYFPTPPSSGVPAQPLTLAVDGATVQHWLVPRQSRRALIYFGGNAEDTGWSVAQFAAAIDDRTLVFAQYRGYGGSSGAPSESALIADAIALFDLLARDHDDIAVVGRSLGSGVAVQLAARRPVTSLVLVTPFDSLVAVGQAAMPWLPVSLLARDRYESTRIAQEVTARTLLLVAEADRIVPPRHAQALFDAFPSGRAELTRVTGAGHNDIQLWPQYYRRIAEFVR
jgi:hypothetical protein